MQKESKRKSSWLFDALAGVCVLVACNLLLPGCVFDTSGISTPIQRLQCEGKIYKYGTMPNGQPGFAVTKNGSHSMVKSWKPFSLGTHLFGGTPAPPYKPTKIVNPVKGSYLLQLHRADRNETQNPVANPSDFLLKLQLAGQDIDNIWIAFDKRVNKPPSWLTQHFELPSAPTGEIKRVPTTICPNAENCTADPRKLVKYWIWQPKDLNSLLQGDLLLGGNNTTGTTWIGNVVGEQYLVLVRMKVGLDISKKNPVKDNKVVIEYCNDSCPSTIPSAQHTARAVADRLKKWVDDHSSFKDAYERGQMILEQDSTTCDCVDESNFGKSCSKLTSGGGQDRLVNSWVKSSTGRIDPATAELTIQVIDAESGSVKGGGVTALAGEIEFRIDPDSNVSIGELTMYAEDVNLSDGTRLRNLSIGQDATIVAECNDGLPPGPFRLCNNYLVPALPDPGFKASAYCQVNGNHLPVDLVNTNPMPLTVDLNSMTYLMVGGPLEGSFTINNHPYTVRVSIDIAGYFDSLAPVASVAETMTEFECGDGGMGPVRLDASDSDDELHPGTIMAYSWVEDAGALTEIVHGSSKVQWVSMPLGVHDMTLFVQDTDSIWNSHEFEVAVVDTRIDSVDPPSDVWVMVAPGAGGAHVSIGSAGGDDYCSGRVQISNDADPNGWYPSGVSVVTWRFDDFHGNIVEHQQKISVLEPQFYPPPWTAAVVNLAQVYPGDFQEISHQTQSQGQAMIADEYIVLYGPEESVWSFHESGELVEGDIVAHATDTVFGAESTEATVFEGVFSDHFWLSGDYTVEALLVRPGADPREPEEVISRAWATFSYNEEG